MTQNASKHKIRQILSLRLNKIWGDLCLDEIQLNGQIVKQIDVNQWMMEWLRDSSPHMKYMQLKSTSSYQFDKL